MGKGIKTKSAPKVENSFGKRLVAIILMLAGIALLLFLAKNIVDGREELVQVIRITRNIQAGDPITDKDIKAYDIPKSTYESLGMVPLADEKGNVSNKQTLLLWKQAKEVYDQEKGIASYASTYLKNGSLLTSTDLTKEITVRNPWVAAIKPDEEIFTMSFDAGSVNARLLFPGTRLRARLISEVPSDLVEDIRSEINTAENVPVKDIVRPSTVTQQKDKFDDASGTNVQVAEIVIDEVIITDMTNGSGESIYDLYMSLLKLPINVRADYLKTTLGDNSTAKSWASRVTPATITFILDKSSASRLAEFEKSSGTIKYTILPDDPENEEQANLMTQFIELSNQINTVTGGK